jgi:hypothetical protein
MKYSLIIILFTFCGCKSNYIPNTHFIDIEQTVVLNSDIVLVANRGLKYFVEYKYYPRENNLTDDFITNYATSNMEYYIHNGRYADSTILNKKPNQLILPMQGLVFVTGQCDSLYNGAKTNATAMFIVKAGETLLIKCDKGYLEIKKRYFRKNP